MQTFNIFLFLFFIGIGPIPKLQALEYSKIEFPGCPENAYCKKETGANRLKWISVLKDFSALKISEEKINTFIQAEYGIPIAAWALEEATLLPNILMWESPCKQHKIPGHKIYISEIFRKNLNPLELKNISYSFFDKAILFDSKEKPYAVFIPRLEEPLFIINENLYFLIVEEGLYYGLLIDKSGALKIIKPLKPEISKKPFLENPLIETECSKEQKSFFSKDLPVQNFYQSLNCKSIWNRSTNSFNKVILGRSCY